MAALLFHLLAISFAFCGDVVALPRDARGSLGPRGPPAPPAPPHQSSKQQFILGSNFGVSNVPATYDYVIIGGGQAGLVLANRLTASGEYSVAVVEAGSFYEITNGNNSEIPALAETWNAKSPLDTSPGADWGYTTTPQAGAYGDVIHFPRGKMLGGSSARNTMAYQRGTKGSYQLWADLVDDQSFNFDNISPFFIKSENFTPPDIAKRGVNATPSYDPSSLGEGGFLDITYANYASTVSTWIQKGLAAVGIQPRKGFTSGGLIGSSYIIATINHTTGERESSETAYLRPSLGRPNLYLYVQTMAKQITFNGTKATGAVLETGGYKYNLTANKEVILSAGAIGSPQLLMVSGVGPASTLKSLDIPVIADRPGVGQNMWDQIIVGPSYRVNVETVSSLGYGDAYPVAVEEYLTQQAGILSSPGGDFAGYEKIPASERECFTSETKKALEFFPADWPEVEYISVPSYLGYQWDYSVAPHDGYQYATLTATVLTPTSRGNVSINSKDTNDQPLINPNWMTTESDQQVAVAAYKRVRQVWDSLAMKPVVIGEEYFPGRNVSTDAEILDIIRKSFNTIDHAACTNKMGKANDPMAVTDTHGRVYGTQNLRVVDASILPILTPGLPMGTVYMVAEKVAEQIVQGE